MMPAAIASQPAGKKTLRGILPIVSIVGLGLAGRLLEPVSYARFDESIYTQTLLLWLSGVAPYKETFYSQGPLLLILLAPFALLFGPLVEAAQLAVTVWGTVGIIAIAVIGYKISGPWGGAIAAAVTAASPLLTNADTHAMAEGPAVALAVLSVAVMFGGPVTTRRWAIAGALFGASIAVKSLMPAAVVITLGLIAMSDASLRQRLTCLAMFGLAAVLVFVIAVLPFDLASVWDALVIYRFEARAATTSAPGDFERTLTRGFRDDLGTLVAAVVGLLVLLRTAPRMGLLLGGWLLATLALLAVHQPLFPRHAVALVPPLAALAAGCGRLDGVLPRPRLLFMLKACIIVAILALSATYHYRRVTEAEGLGDLAEAGAALRAASSPTEYVLTDIPAAALLGDRAIVPSLVDFSGVRISTGRINPEMVERETERYRPAAILFWLGRLDSGPLESYPASITEHYSRVWQNAPRQALWIREDAEELDVRGIPGLRILGDARFGLGLVARAIGYSGQVRPGDTWRLRVLWELEGRPEDAETVQLRLVTNSGSVVAQAESPFSEIKPIAAWPPTARRMVQYEVPIPTSMEPRRVTPELRLRRSDGSNLRLDSRREGSADGALDLPPIQIVRGSSSGR